jgi:2-iminobutanoate/2-iminopropanoate deaminase
LNLIAHRISRITVLMAAAFTAAACTTSGGILPWVKQGPGNTAEDARAEQARTHGQAQTTSQPQPQQQARAPQASQPAAAAPAPSRQVEVAPELIAQSPPPPRSPAEQAAAAAGSAASYTQGTRYGDLVFISGQIALDMKTSQMRGATIEDQTRAAMENIRGVLEAHRLTFANVVSTTVYLRDINDFRGMNAAYESFFRGALPARSVVAVSQLPRGALVEISAVAGR